MNIFEDLTGMQTIVYDNNYNVIVRGTLEEISNRNTYRVEGRAFTIVREADVTVLENEVRLYNVEEIKS